jgi:hypothetical protein
MRWLIGVAAAWAMVGMLAVTAQAQTCVMSNWEINDRTGEMATGRLEARAGVRCATRITGSSRTNVRVDQQPQHGRVELTENGYAYTADPSYAGPDVFRITWFSSGATARMGVDVLVTVVARPTPPPAAAKPPAPAAARPAAAPAAPRGPDGLGLYGMLVYSRQARSYGLSVNQPSVDAALRLALRQCGQGDCVVMTPIRTEECVAFAVGDTDRYWLRTRGSDPAARVLERCGQRTTNCQMVVSRCI